MKINKKIVVMALPVLILSILIGVKFHYVKENNDDLFNGLPVSTMSASYEIDTDNPAEVVGSADYVFSTTIIADNGPIYKNPVQMEQKDGTIIVDYDPYTKYTISIVENIKGMLECGTQIPITKWGGKAYNQDVYFIPEDDILPVVGKTYIMSAYVQTDGSLLVSGAGSTTIVTNSSFSTNRSNDTIEEYQDAVNNEVVENRVRYKVNPQFVDNN